MNPVTIAASSNHSPLYTYSVALKQETEAQWTATALGWWNCSAEGATREEALAKLDQVLAEQLAQVEIVQQPLPLPQRENPWLKVAGKYKDDPQFEAVLQHIAAYRRELDADMNVEGFNQDEAKSEQ
jgi:predicted RNase H-like HicB family nuclease